MGKRIEHKKTIVFSSEEEKILYEAITDLESSKEKMTPSALVVSIVEEKYIPEDPDAKEFCKRLYLMEKSRERFWDVLGDIFVFLSGKTSEDRYEKNLCLFNYFYKIVGYDVEIIPSRYEAVELKKLLIKLELIDKVERQTTLSKIFICPDSGRFIPRNLINTFIADWKRFYRCSECYMAMSYLCRVLSDDMKITIDSRSELINLIRTMSEKWKYASD